MIISLILLLSQPLITLIKQPSFNSSSSKVKSGDNILLLYMNFLFWEIFPIFSLYFSINCDILSFNEHLITIEGAISLFIPNYMYEKRQYFLEGQQ